MSEHYSHEMHENSLRALREALDSGAFNAREKQILLVYQRRPEKPFTDRDVMDELGYHDPNMVRPRITELVDKGWLSECDEGRVDRATGKLVRQTILNPDRNAEQVRTKPRRPEDSQQQLLF